MALKLEDPFPNLLLDTGGLFAPGFASSAELDSLLEGMDAPSPGLEASGELDHLLSAPAPAPPLLGLMPTPGAACNPPPLDLPSLPVINRQVQRTVAVNKPPTQRRLQALPPPVLQPVSAVMSSDSSDDEDACTKATSSTGGDTHPAIAKRRRRTRNAKQQELNRLAQQRYRQRKKQRQQDLQHTVENLATQLELLKARDAEIEELKQEKAEMQKKLRAHEDRLSAQQQSPTGAPSSSPALLEPAQLLEGLVCVLRDVLADLGVQPSTQLHESLQKHLARAMGTGSTCGRALSAAQVVKVPVEAAPGVAVSCC